MKTDKQHNKSKSKPKVSVIIPCYNHGKYLNEAVDSVLNQTMQDFEIIIVNDGSTDKFTNALLRNYNKPKTKVIFQKNQKLPSARNNGIKIAEGKYILPLDADDKIDKTYLEKAINILNKNENIDFVTPWVQTFGTDNYIWKTHVQNLKEILSDNYISTPVFKKSCWKRVGGYDDKMIHGYEDWDLWISFIEKGFKGAVIKEPLYLYRRKEKSMISESAKKRSHILMYILKKHKISFHKNAEDICIQKDRQLQEAWKFISALKKGKEWFFEEMTNKDKYIAELLKAKKGYLNQIKNKEDYVAELLKAKKWYLNQIKDRERLIKNKEDYIAELEKAKEWLLDQIKQKDGQAKDGKRRIKEKKSQIFMIRNSISWKITRSLRALRRRLKKIIKLAE